MQGSPIKITLYDAQGEAKQEYTCSMIPWGILKKAVALTKNVNSDEVSEGSLDAIASLVVQAFGNQFTLQELDEGADIGEMLAVLQSIVARASTIVTANPTPPIPSKKHSK